MSARVKELLKKPVLSDHEVKEVLEELKKSYKSKYWVVAENILKDYLDSVQKDDLDELLGEVGLEGEKFRKPQFRRMKLIKSTNSKMCGELVDPQYIGHYVSEHFYEDENGERQCDLQKFGREVECIPILRIPYVNIRITMADGSTRVYRVFPSPEEIKNPYPFMKRVADRAQKILVELPDIDDFKVRKSSLLYIIAKPEKGLPTLYELDLTPVDSMQINDFEKKLKQRTGISGYGAIFRVGKKAVLSSKKVQLQGNKYIVLATAMDFSSNPIVDTQDWKVITIPIAVSVLNYISKLPHEFRFAGSDIESPSGSVINADILEEKKEEEPTPKVEETAAQPQTEPAVDEEYNYDFDEEGIDPDEIGF